MYHCWHWLISPCLLRKVNLYVWLNAFIKNVYFGNCYQIIRSLTETFLINSNVFLFPLLIIFDNISMNRICSADRQRKAERSERQRRCDNSRVKRTHASRPRCLRERFDQEGAKREREKREKGRQISLHLLHEPSNPWTAMPTHPPIDNRPLALWNSGSCDTASDWSAAHLFSPASYRSRATPAQDPTSSHGFAPDARSMLRKVSVEVLVSIPTGLVFIRHQVRAGVQNLFPDSRFVTIKTPKTRETFFLHN